MPGVERGPLSSGKAGGTSTRQRPSHGRRPAGTPRSSATPAKPVAASTAGRGKTSSTTTSRTERRARIRRRRGILLVAATACLCAGILAAWLPVSAVLHEHHDLSQATSQLDQLRQDNRTLAQAAAALGNPAQASQIAREQYQQVPPGEQAYEVLPPAGKGSGQYAGDPGLQKPVSPDRSQSDLPTTPTTASGGTGSLQVTGSNAAGQGSATTQPGGTRSASGSTPSSGGSILGRIERTLEFWR